MTFIDLENYSWKNLYRFFNNRDLLLTLKILFFFTILFIFYTSLDQINKNNELLIK